MSEYWFETKNLYMNLLDRPPLKEKYLKKPSPKYIFCLIINTLKITGFPLGLFSEEEQSLEYFLEDVENKRIFLTKVIELTEIIIKENFGINIDNILKGKECDKTHKFLQNLYNIATSGVDYSSVIEKYLIDNNYNLSWIKGKNNSGNARYIYWIDGKDENDTNENHENNNDFDNLKKSLNENSEFRFISKLEPRNLKTLNDVFGELRIKDYEIVFIIINEALYSDYYYRLKRYRNIIKCIPITIILTSEDIKKRIKNHIKIHYFSEEVYSSINDAFFNFGGVSSDYNSCLDFISNFVITMKKEFNPRQTPRSNFNGCLTFEYINSLNQLIVPILYNEMLNEDIKVSDNEVQYFKYLLLNRHGEKAISNLIHPLLYVKDMPHEILAKYFAKAYTEETSFYKEMNNSLMKQNVKEYEAFIRIMYEGLANKSLSISEDNKLFRGSYMSRNEMNAIIKKFEEYQQKKEKDLPSFLLYSRCFLSFSKIESVAKGFLGNNNDVTYAVYFILENHDDILNKYSSNADITYLSAFQSEQEVLFFPYTSFCLKSIEHKEIKNDDGEVIKNYVEVQLDYLGRYDKALELFSKDEFIKNEVIEEFVDCFNQQNYSKQLLNANIIKSKQKGKDTNKNYVFEKMMEKIEDKYDLKVNQESNGKNLDKYSEYIDVNEINKVHNKNIAKDELEEIPPIQEIIVESNPRIFFINFAPSKYFTTRWIGNYNMDNQRHGIGKEYNIDNYLLFDGEYEKGQKNSGKEYYIMNKLNKGDQEDLNDKNNLKFKGDYQYGKWYKGILYDMINNNEYNIESGNGVIKEYYENGCLAYEGELKDGNKSGKGKIYNIEGSLIYDGKLNNGIKVGKGKEYDSNRNLIFEGTFVNGKIFKTSKINRYNELGELIYQKDDDEEKNFLSIKDYKNNIMIKYGIWVMEKLDKEEKRKSVKSNNSSSQNIKNLSKKREKIIFKKLKFEEEENDGKNGKVQEYDLNDNLVFEGEYKDGQRYNGTYIVRMISKIYYFIIERGIFVQKKVEEINKNDLIYEGDCENGEGKILNVDGKILFIGKFENKLKKKGKEFNENKKLIFDGEYFNGNIYNGKGKEFLKNELVFKGDYQQGIKYKGTGKEYSKKHILLFDGEYDEGQKIEGKEYFKHGGIKFDGLYKNSNYSKGKEYNYDTQLIFDGRYNNGKRWKGKGKEFNKIDKELIYEGEYDFGLKSNGKIIIKKKQRSNKNNIIFEGYYLNGEKYKGIEYNKSENSIFEGEFKKGVKFKGKEYYYYKNDILKFQGEYQNGIKYKGKEYDYGRLIFDGTFDNGKKNYGKEYDVETGIMLFEGSYDNGIKSHGKEYDKDRNLIFDGEYKNGKIWTGKIIEYKCDNCYITDGNYKEGKLQDGKVKIFDINNMLIFDGEYRNGNEYKGKSFEYNDLGQLVFIFDFDFGDKNLNTEIKYSTDKNNKTLIYQYLHNEYTKSYYKKELIFEGELKDRKRWNGTGKEYNYQDEELIFEGEYKMGKRWNGKGKEFNDKNELIYQGEYKKGKRWNGEGKEYDKKGRLIYDGKYVNGLNDKGLEYNDTNIDIDDENENKYDKEYDDDGQLIFEGEFKNGLRYKGKEYDDGMLVFNGEYKNEKRWNGKGIEYDSLNNQIFEGEYKEGKKWKGKGNDYNSYGGLLFEKEYNNGMIIKEVEYNLEGKKIFEGEYQNNEKYKGKEYNDFGELIFEGEYKDNERFEGKGKNNLFEFNYINGLIESQNIVVYDYINHELFIGEYKNGEKYNGILRTYFDDISYILKREVEVKEASITGYGKEYYGNQKLKYEGHYENGKKNGEGVLYYRLSGYINYIGNFKDGKKDGQGKEYDNWGNLIYEGLFSNDKRI